METQIKNTFNVVDYQIERSVVKIQAAVRKMLARKRFRLSLYKLMLLKNLIENKVHKEKMQMLYAFEQMIINTEDDNDQEYYDELYGEEQPTGPYTHPDRIMEDSKEDEEDDGDYGSDDEEDAIERE